MIHGLRTLARRRETLVALSDAQRALLGLELGILRECVWPPLVGRIAPRVAIGGALGTAALLVLQRSRPRRLLKLASAAIAVYPLMRRLLAVLRGR